jgi:RND family efflux transporter MFP subunit
MRLLPRTLSYKTISKLLSITLLTGLNACGNEGTEVKAEIIRPAKIITVGDPLAGSKRVYPGEVEAGDRSEQAFRVGGELVKLPTKAGMRVKQGQLLAQLDPTDFQLSVDEQQARYDLSNIQFKRTETLVKQKLIPESDFDKAKSNLLSATADLRLAKAQLSYTKLLAPFDGVVSILNVKNHENVRQNEVILVIQTTDNIDITFNLSENIISTLKKRRGSKYHPNVVFDTYPGNTYETTVKEFDTEADPQTRSYKVTLTMPAPKEFIALPGMSVNVHLDFSKIVKNPSSTLVVPVEAVFAPEDKNLKSKTHMVWKVDSATMQTQSTQVSIGQINSQGIEIKSGLQSGDQIIVAGVNFIKEGQKVKPWIKEEGL